MEQTPVESKMLDEGDEEVHAIQRNPQLMARIAECVERAHNRPTKSLTQIKAEIGLNDTDSN